MTIDIIDIIKEILSIFSSVAVTAIVSIVAALLIYGFKTLCNRFGININSETMSEIISIISQVIKYLDQKYVDTIKNNSVDGTLTEYQKQIIKEKSVTIIKTILNSDQIDFLLEKYNMEDIDDVLDILIESTIKDVRINNSETIIINDDNSDLILNESNDAIATVYNPTAKELASLELCPGDCETCTLSKDCIICRLSSELN